MFSAVGCLFLAELIENSLFSWKIADRIYADGNENVLMDVKPRKWLNKSEIE